jgi:hypothetical protein
MLDERGQHAVFKRQGRERAEVNGADGRASAGTSEQGNEPRLYSASVGNGVPAGIREVRCGAQLLVQLVWVLGQEHVRDHNPHHQGERGARMFGNRSATGQQAAPESTPEEAEESPRGPVQEAQAEPVWTSTAPTWGPACAREPWRCGTSPWPNASSWPCSPT